MARVPGVAAEIVDYSAAEPVVRFECIARICLTKGQEVFAVKWGIDRASCIDLVAEQRDEKGSLISTRSNCAHAWQMRPQSMRDPRQGEVRP